MAKSVDFYQVYYSDEQKEKLYDFAIPYFNIHLSDYFENSIIAELVPQSGADRVAVTSWRLSKKRIDRSMQLKGKTDLTIEMLTENEYDIACLTPTSNSHQAISMASKWHGPAWDNAIKELKKFIHVPDEIKKPIYENHFVANADIYRDYVRNCLNPCIDFIHTRGVFFADSGYIHRKSVAEQQRYKDLTGRKDYPIAPFILERLFSIWIDDKGFKIINL